MESPEGRIEMKDYYRTKTITKEDVDKLLDDYYEERGWEPRLGIPTPKKLKSLGLDKYSGSLKEIG